MERLPTPHRACRGTHRLRRVGTDRAGRPCTAERQPRSATIEPWPPRPPCYRAGLSTILTFISIRSFGRSFWPRGAFTILSATSMPRITSPKTVYWRSRKGESFTTMKNCEPALSGLLDRAIETIPRLWDLALNSAFILWLGPSLPYSLFLLGFFVLGSPPCIM